jgi:glycosyltransferase involved in cell wall biosynthesis
LAIIVNKIAIFNRHFSRLAGGAEGYSVAVTDGLADLGYEVHVFAQTLPMQGEARHPLVRYHKVPGPIKRPRWINQLWFAAYTWWQTRRSLGGQGFDVIHSHENTWHGDVQTVHVRPIRYNLLFPNHVALAGWRLALRWFKICTSPRLGFYVWLEAARMRKPFVVAVSEETKRQTLAAYPHLTAAHVPVILPGVGEPNLLLAPSQARTKLGLPQDKKIILFVGNDYARKGLPALLAAMQGLEANIHAVCVGAVQQIPKFQLMAAELGITQRVHFVGALTDMSLAYRSADLLVHPTLEDAFAMVVLEAMSYGLPVVVSSASYCGISAFLKDGVDVLMLMSPQDKPSAAHAIAHHVQHIFQDDSARQALSIAGLRFAAQHQWDKAIDQYVQIYSAIPPTTLLKPPST